MTLRISSFLHPLALALAIQATPGCKTTEVHDQATTTADRIEAVGARSGLAQQRLDATLAALEQVREKAETDSQPAFKTFSSELAGFETELGKLVSARGSMKSAAETWFQQYETQTASIEDAQLREASAKRLTDFRSRVEKVSASVDDLVTESESIQGRLEDMRTYLGADLTPKGIEAVEGRIGDLAKDGRNVAEKLGKFSESSASAAQALRSAQPPPAQPK